MFDKLLYCYGEKIKERVCENPIYNTLPGIYRKTTSNAIDCFNVNSNISKYLPVHKRTEPEYETLKAVLINLAELSKDKFKLITEISAFIKNYDMEDPLYYVNRDGVFTLQNMVTAISMAINSSEETWNFQKEWKELFAERATALLIQASII